MLLVVDGSVDVAEYDGVFARVGCGRPIEQQESLVDISRRRICQQRHASVVKDVNDATNESRPPVRTG